MAKAAGHLMTKEDLQKNWGVLKKDVRFVDICDGLLERFLISVDDNIRIKNLPSEIQQMEEVLNLLYKSKITKWNILFIEVLENAGYDHIVRTIQGTESTSTAEPEVDEFQRVLKITPEDFVGASGCNINEATEASLNKTIHQQTTDLKKHMTDELRSALKEAMSNLPTKEDIIKKDRHIEEIIQKKDRQIEEVIQKKDRQIEEVIQKKDRKIEEVIQKKDRQIAEAIQKKDQEIAELEKRLKVVEEKLEQERKSKMDYEALLKGKEKLVKELTKTKQEIKALTKKNEKIQEENQNLKDNNLKKAYNKPLVKLNRK